LKTNEFNVLPGDCFVAFGLPSIVPLKAGLRRGGRAPRNDIKIPRNCKTKYWFFNDQSLYEHLSNHDRSNMVAKEILVIGGGIAGIQASLDLAEMGFKVKLVERLPSIGGKMAQLDKTFPTNDCAI